MDIKSIFSYNLKRLRDKQRYTQSELADLINSNSKYIGQIEQKMRFPSPKMIEKLAEALGCRIQELFIENDEMIFVNQEGIEISDTAREVKYILENTYSQIRKLMEK
jgi:transcriptional regulator with XRE-family HTH domain